MVNSGGCSIGFCFAILVIMFSFVLSNAVGGVEYATSHILISANAEWRYQENDASLESAWRQLDFNDASWMYGKAGFGYGDDDDRTHLKTLHGQAKALRIRHVFTLDPADGMITLYLYLRFDDAFIAYLNGREIARSGVSDRGGKRVIEQHEARGFELFPVVLPAQVLKKGANVLAIEGLNHSITSSDFTLHPVLATQRLKSPGLPVTLTRKEMQDDLSYLRQRLEDQSSYLPMKKFDHDRSFNKFYRHLDQQISPLAFGRGLRKIIAQIGDAHADVELNVDRETDRYLPFVIADTSIGFVAINADHSSYLNENFPILHKIDGKPVDYWLELASRYVPQASPQLIRREALRELRSIDRIRADAGTTLTEFVDIVLLSADHGKQLELRLDTSEKRLPSGKVVLGASRILEGNTGYLRIPKMNNAALENALSDMTRFQNTNALIIDVRGNRGGRYKLLQALYGYFVPRGNKPYVTNISAYRLSSKFDDDHLHYRPTYREKYVGWIKADKKAIQKTLKSFQPEWTLPVNKYSAWHFMLLGRSGDPGQYHYLNPVAVLSDAGSFSATDGFLSAFSDLPQVTLIGQASAGGSGATQHFNLPNSGISIALSSMVSFRPNGRLFDGHGVEVDIVKKPEPGDYIGQSDAVLKRAVEWLRQRTNG